MKKSIALILAVVMIFTIFPKFNLEADAAGFSVDRTIAYAEDHWNDGVGLCAEFVANCVIAGGLDIELIKRVQDLAEAICEETGLDMIPLKLDENGHATKTLDGDILDKGDVVVQWCNTHNSAPHVILCNGYNSSGRAVYYAHNSAMDGTGTYKLSVNLAYAHTGNCDMGAKVIHLSSMDGNEISTPEDTKPQEPGEVTANWKNYDKKPNSIGNTNALLSKTVSLSGADISAVQKIGFHLYYGDSGMLLASKVEAPLPAGQKINMWYDINGELGYTLEENTKYVYEFEVTLNDGSVHKTPKESFVTGPDKGYKVRFDPAGGTSPKTEILVANKSCYGSLPTPTYGDATFLGWYTKPTGGSLVTSATVAELSDSSTLYARWDGEPSEEEPDYSEDYEEDPESITVYFDPGKGKCDINSVVVYPGETIPYIPTPVRSGYTFEGWYAGQEYNNYKVSERTVINIEEDITLYAKWTKKQTAFPFKDVDKDDWFYEDVRSAYDMGIVSGKTASDYEPDTNMTYAEAIKLASCMHQLYHEGEVSLESTGEQWYSSYVEYAKENGIPWKCNDYNANITRRSFVHIFYYALPEECLEGINYVNSIPDVGANDKFAKEIYTFYRAGILTGMDEIGSFGPGSPIRRSEVAAIITRMFNENARKSIMD